MLRSAHPILYVSDMREALFFFEERLGFRRTFAVEDELHPLIPYAIVERDDVAIHLSLSATAAGTSSCYITVNDADALYAEYRRTGATVTRSIEESSYGMRDFNITDIDGNTISFGQPISVP